MVPKSDESLSSRTARNAVSGTVAGVAVCLVGHPFDTLKVRLQTQPVNSPVYAGLADCFFKTIKWEGVGGLYKGVGSPLVGQMFFRAILFSSYYQFQIVIAHDRPPGSRLKPHEYFIAGGMTGAVASLIEGPIDLFKTKMQIQILRARSGAKVQYRNVFHAGWVILRQQGLRGVYQGLSATWLRNIPSFGNYFGFFELSRSCFLSKGQSVAELPLWVTFVSGGIGGFLYWFLTYPTDVIKSAIQSDDADRTKRRFRGIIHCAKIMYLEEGGVQRFYRGFLPCMMRSIPANAIMLLTLEACRLYLPKF